jgi:KaiC/GvpD/RAD55 family RecA-like ATPase
MSVITDLGSRLQSERTAREESEQVPEVSPLLTMPDLLSRDLARIENPPPRLATGFPRFDRALGGGFEVPSLNVIGAGPKSLKSTWCQVVAERHAAAGGAVYYLDLENGSRRFLRRLLCRHAGLGRRDIAAALASPDAPVFESREAAEAWREAQEWARSLPILTRFSPPPDFKADLVRAKALAEGRPLLAVFDSLQKLPGDLTERRATVDGWVRMFEQLRLDLEAVFLVVSEVRRGREGYAPREDAFKESSGIEYGADLAFTLSRAAADEDEEGETSTMRIEFARDTEEDPRGDVASYRPLRPYYGIEEIDPVERKKKGGKPSKKSVAGEWLRDRLANGPVLVSVLRNDAARLKIAWATLDRAKREDLGAKGCNLNGKAAWRLP